MGSTFKKVHVGNDQENAQSQRNSHSKYRGGKIHTIPSSWTNNVIKVFISWISKFCVSVNMYEIYLSSYISRLHTIVFILWIAKRFTTAVMVGGEVR